jgi:Phage integrase family
MPRKEYYLPVILSPAEVLRFLEAAPSYSYRVIFSTMYGTGMRVSEALHLRMHHIDSQRMMIRIEQSKGNRDRDVPLSPKLLELLRTYWRKVRPREWLFPGQNPDQPLRRAAVGQATQAPRRAGLTKKPSPHCLDTYPRMGRRTGERSTRSPAFDCPARQSHAWVAMEVETKFLRLFNPAAPGDHIDGWRVCWVGGWDKCRTLFVVDGRETAPRPSVKIRAALSEELAPRTGFQCILLPYEKTCCCNVCSRGSADFAGGGPDEHMVG